MFAEYYLYLVFLISLIHKHSYKRHIGILNWFFKFYGYCDFLPPTLINEMYAFQANATDCTAITLY